MLWLGVTTDLYDRLVAADFEDLTAADSAVW